MNKHQYLIKVQPCHIILQKRLSADKPYQILLFCGYDIIWVSRLIKKVLEYWRKKLKKHFQLLVRTRRKKTFVRTNIETKS